MPYSLKVLLIDDDPCDQVLVREQLSRVPGQDYQIDVVPSYGVGVVAVTEARHDVYLVDYRLGARTGIDFVEEVVAKGCDRPLIVLAGRCDHGVAVRATIAGAADYLTKDSLNPDLLERVIRHTIGRFGAQRALRRLREELEARTQVRTAALETRNQELQREIGSMAVQHARDREQVENGGAAGMSLLRDEFLATLSHELRAPLNAIVGWTQLLLKKQQQVDAAVLAEGLNVILRNARAQAGLIEDLLDVSRMVSGRLHIHMGRVVLHDLVHALAEAVRPDAAAKSISLQVDAEAGLGAIPADADRLRQVLENLLSNAVKFTPAGGWVTVRAWRGESRAVIEVRDSGEGTPAEVLPIIFEGFRQADSSLTRRYQGLGLGLTIARHLVELHGGTIQATSPAPGEGALFRIELPLYPVGVEVPDSAIAAPVPADLSVLRNKRILVVDDDVDSNQMIAKTLSEYGVVVMSAPNGLAALPLIALEMPDALVSDIAMPGISGYQLLDAVRQNPAGAVLPAIAVTGLPEQQYEKQPARAGFDRHLAKPVDPANLVETLARLIDANDARRRTAQP